MATHFTVCYKRLSAAQESQKTLSHEELLQQWVNEAGISDHQKQARSEAKRRILSAKTSNARCLNLSQLNLTSIPSGAFKGLSALERLNLYNNDLRTLEPYTFQELTHLKIMSLGYNDFDELQPNTFTGLSSLTELDLSYCKFKNNLHADTFHGLSALTTLYLCRSSIETLEEDTFQGLSSLTTLDLSYNYIKTIQQHTFRGLSALTELDLTMNLISPESAIHLEEFAKANPRLSIQFTITKPPSHHERLTNWVDEPGIDKSQKQARSEAKRRILSAKESKDYRLILSGLGLTSLPFGAFEGLSSLQQLALSHNHIKTLPPGTFQELSALQDLTLSYNEIASLQPNTFQGLSLLRNLDLSRNNIQTLPQDTFQGLSLLTNLDLSDNDIQTLPQDTFQGLSLLTNLGLRDNDILTFPPGIFRGLSVLQELDLCQNNIQTLPQDTFQGLSDLRLVLLDFNPITPETAAHLETLAQLQPGLRVQYDMEGFQRTRTGASRPSEHPSSNFLSYVASYLGAPVSSQEAAFWNNPDFQFFKEWICRLNMINVSDRSAHDRLTSHIKDILTLFHQSEPFRSVAMAAIANNQGCGDRKAVIYTLLVTALPLYPGQSSSQTSQHPLSYPHFRQLYRSHHAVQLILNDVINRRLDGDQAGQILAALLALNSYFNLGIDHIGMCFPFTAGRIPLFIENIKSSVVQQLDSQDHFITMISQPFFDPLRQQINDIQTDVNLKRDKAIEAFEDQLKKQAESAKKTEAYKSQRDSLLPDTAQHDQLVKIQTDFEFEFRVRVEQLFD